MRKRSVVFLFVFFYAMFLQKTYATHIVGGYMAYKNLGSNNYEIRLTIFRDCNGNPPFDPIAQIGIFDSQNNVLDTINILFPGNDTLPPSINSPCLSPPVGICYERAIYIDTVNLPPMPGGYQLAYQRCCRNVTILNVFDPMSTGETFYATIPSNSITQTNSNPVFKNQPPLFLCINYPYSFDHSATDLDGDSLVYETATPLNSTQLFPGGPQFPEVPPYFPITFQAPYSLANFLGGVPLSINSHTGLLAVTPNTLGQFVVGIKVKEYRNGVLLSQTIRDFQFNVVSCPNLIVAEIVIPVASLQAIVVCGTNTVQFNNNSFGAVTYKWNFGDGATLADTSNTFQPNYTYPGPGSYHSYLVAYSSNPNCNDTSFATVNVYPPFTSDISYILDPCTQTVNFTDASTFPGFAVTNHTWNFGDGATSTLQNPTHIYSNPGTYNVTLKSSSILGCSGNKNITVVVPSINTISVSGAATICLGDSAQLSVSGGFNYVWIPSSSLTNSTIANPFAHPTTTTTYTLTSKVLTSLGDTCTATKTVTITVNTLPQSIPIVNPISCGKKTIQITNNSINAQSYLWNFGDSNSPTNSSTLTNPIHVFSDTGAFQISLIAFTQNNQQGCTDTVVGNIHIYPSVIANFGYDVESCSNTVSFLDSTADAFSAPSNWAWAFGDGQFSGIKNPVHTYSFFGIFNATLIASTSVGCMDTITLPLNLTALAAAVGPNDTVQCDGIPVQIFASGGIAYKWTPPIGLSNDTISNPLVSITSTTIYTVAITAIATDGDTCIITKNVTVFVPFAQLPALQATADNDTLFAGQSTTIHAIPNQNNFFYFWTPASFLNSNTLANPTTTPAVTITYQVVMSDSFQCKRQAEVTITIIPLSCAESEVFIPNTFTPNNDGQNDVFRVRGNQIKELYFAVYNRWGEKVFETNDVKSGWDGTYRGNPSEPAVFGYYARIICLNNDQLIKQGNVTLIR